MTDKIKRPEIKNYFDNIKNWEQIHKVYSDSKELFNYAKDLDLYIDYLEQTEQESEEKSISFNFCECKHETMKIEMSLTKCAECNKIVNQ